MHTKRAFTLIELLVVGAIIAIFAAIAVPNFRGFVVEDTSATGGYKFSNDANSVYVLLSLAPNRDFDILDDTFASHAIDPYDSANDSINDGDVLRTSNNQCNPQ